MQEKERLLAGDVTDEVGIRLGELEGTIADETAADARKPSENSRIIPGNWGKIGSGWLVRSLQNRPQGQVAEAIFTSSSGGGRAPSVTRCRSCAVRSDEKPLRAESSSLGWFRTWANRSYPEGKWLLLCTSTEHVTLAESLTRRAAKERRRKAGQKEHVSREEHEG
jgi:hypothetical protein